MACLRKIGKYYSVVVCHNSKRKTYFTHIINRDMAEKVLSAVNEYEEIYKIRQALNALSENLPKQLVTSNRQKRKLLCKVLLQLGHSNLLIKRSFTRGYHRSGRLKRQLSYIVGEHLKDFLSGTGTIVKQQSLVLPFQSLPAKNLTELSENLMGKGTN